MSFTLNCWHTDETGGWGSCVVDIQGIGLVRWSLTLASRSSFLAGKQINGFIPGCFRREVKAGTGGRSSPRWRWRRAGLVPGLEGEGGTVCRGHPRHQILISSSSSSIIVIIKIAIIRGKEGSAGGLSAGIARSVKILMAMI